MAEGESLVGQLTYNHCYVSLGNLAVGIVPPPPVVFLALGGKRILVLCVVMVNLCEGSPDGLQGVPSVVCP